jgi:hypothetical protein
MQLQSADASDSAADLPNSEFPLKKAAPPNADYKWSEIDLSSLPLLGAAKSKGIISETLPTVFHQLPSPAVGADELLGDVRTAFACSPMKERRKIFLLFAVMSGKRSLVH